ncbi:hypothetical protein [Streptomyces sp. UG1]|uniref:hypothetical protein n=1 Tax=Streptomyces sp. UG1 TaxID=3417652 RepID=UPI003CF13DF6
MPDDIFGDALPQSDRPSRKRQLADKDQRSRDDRIDDCLNYPLIYELAELLPPPSAVGCPRGYPSVTYLLIAAMMTVTGSKRSALGTLSPKQWRSVRSAVRRHAGRRAAILLPAEAPSRHQYLYAENKLLAPSLDLLHERFEEYAVQQALAQGLFPIDVPRNWARPERRRLLAVDATVPKAPSKAEPVDTTTGEIRPRRVDPAARLYYENGEDKKTVVRGTKVFFASARDDGYWQRVILTVQHIADREYEDEAAIAVRSFARLQAQVGLRVVDWGVPKGEASARRSRDRP